MFDIPGRALDHCAGVHLVLVIGEGVDVGLGHPHPYTCFPFMLSGQARGGGGMYRLITQLTDTKY